MSGLCPDARDAEGRNKQNKSLRLGLPRSESSKKYSQVYGLLPSMKENVKEWPLSQCTILRGSMLCDSKHPLPVNQPRVQGQHNTE